MIVTELATSVMAFVGGWWILSGPLLWLLLIVGIVLLAAAGQTPTINGGRSRNRDRRPERRFAEAT